MKKQIHKHLHTLEDDIIQTGGLLRALQSLECNDGSGIALLNAIEDRFSSLEKHFYELWGAANE